MREKAKKLSWAKAGDRALLVDHLGKSKVAITSTDTVYGFLGNTSLESYNRICELKNVTSGRPFLMLVGKIDNIFPFIDKQNVSNRKLGFLGRCWPGPVTVILLGRDGSTVAFRSPAHEGLQFVLRQVDVLYSTSANRSGDVTPTCYEEIAPELLQEVEYVVVDEPERGVAKPSTIIDLSDPARDGFTVVREGAYSIEELKKIYESVGE
jgi:L-threonylcarbamoyladenylate synthase